MDDFILGYIEGGLEYDHNYDHDLHRDLELELGNNHDDGPFAALADEVDLLPHYDHDDYHIEYYARSDQGGGFAGVNLGERSVDPEGSGGLQYRHRYESSVSESIGAPSSSDSGSEDVHQHHYHISDDDSEEEEEEQVRGHYGIPFPGRRHISDDESEESDYGSLPSFEVDQVHDYSENEQAEDSSPDEGDYQTSEDDEVHPPSVQWDPLAEVAALSDDEILADLEAIHEIDVFSEDQDSDDSSDDEALARHYDVELSSSSEEQRSNNQYDDNDDDEDQASAANSRRSTSSTSPSEGSIALPSHHQAFLAHHPRGFDALRDLDNLQRERQRLQEDLRQLRDAHFGIPHPVRRANVPNGVDYLLDRLPAPQRDAHGLIAQMEMDLERGRQQRRRAAPSPIRAPPRTQQQQQQPQQREPAFIDLTGDSESPPPEVLALPDAPRFAGRDANPFTPRDQTRSNPRRNNPVRRAPSFARSDGSFLGPGGAPIIDLTNDAPEADLPARLGTPRRRREVQNNDGLVDRVRANAWGAANMNAIFRQMGIPRVGADFLQHMRVALGGGQVDYEVEFIGENIRPDHNHMNGPLANFPIMENPLADNPVDFNYGANGLNQEVARPKPAHIAPPEPREGFTRSTGEDTVVICPSCEEELKYDPDEKGAQPPPAKKVRTTKKDREEHHFWAVKACGHVYCRSCFENRRPTTRNAGMAHFQVVDKRILCAVDECSSDVSTKTAWVGIFL